MVSKKHLDLLNGMSEKVCPDLNLQFYKVTGTSKVIVGEIQAVNKVLFTSTELNELKFIEPVFKARVAAALEDLKDMVDKTLEKLKEIEA